MGRIAGARYLATLMTDTKIPGLKAIRKCVPGCTLDDLVMLCFLEAFLCAFIIVAYFID
ncbi:hypothetical protein C2G38_2235027 [Gigaspora rosea]|uniref:Uncharacterized protein n=1 Tax=Gigaspora rosea TaxID=44941 RepID=A0A397TYL6_9GLOM|nr:hypothetical protein C2G38_2235027 [Gigaspora rosea]